VGGVYHNTAPLGSVGKRDAVRAEMKRSGADVMLLQEVHCPSQEVADEWQREWGGLAFFTDKSSSTGGAAVLFRPGLVPKNIRVDFDLREAWEGAWVRVRYEWGGTEFTVVSAYVPSEMRERKKFLRNELPKILIGPNLILGGDLNCVANAALDVSSLRESPSALGGRRELLKAMNEAEVCDAFREIYPDKRMYTRIGWDLGRGRRQSPARLDRHLVSQEVMPWVKKIHKIITPHSDHDMVMMVVDTGNGLGRGPVTGR
jgi:exonuclease III